MEEFRSLNHSHRQPSTWWAHPLILGVATVIVVIITASFWARPREVTSNDPESILQQEIKQFASEVYELKEQVKEATQAATQEKMIRDQLLMQKEGEYVVQIPFSALQSATPQPTAEVKSNWELWWEVLR